MVRKYAAKKDNRKEEHLWGAFFVPIFQKEKESKDTVEATEVLRTDTEKKNDAKMMQK